MKVKCLYITNEKFFKKKFEHQTYEKYENDLVLGKEYLVYGILYYEMDYNYLIFDENRSPFWYLSNLFEIIENHLSALWYFRHFENSNTFRTIFGYNELVNNEYHNDDLMKENKDNLIEKEERALTIFYKRKKEMDMEFPDFSNKEQATLIDQNWLMCPKCVDAWGSNSIFAMVECPKCKNIMHNPRYKNL